MITSRKSYLSLATAAAIATLAAPLVSANVLEEVVVTASKREQNIQDTNVSITAYSGDQLEALGFQNTVEITQQVPNFQLNTFSPSLTTFNIRGVSQNNFTDNLEPPIAVYVDDGYISSMNAIASQMFDMDRVEVLRGPQGTLFGRNATGGLVHYHTKKADEEELNGYLKGEFGDYSRKVFEGAIGGSLSDTVRFRVAARSEEMDGYVESKEYPGGNPGGVAPSGVDLGGANGYAIRGALQFDLGESTVVDLLVKYSEDEDVPIGGYNFLPYGSNANAYIPPEWTEFFGNPEVVPPEVIEEFGGAENFVREALFCADQFACFAPVGPDGLALFEGDADRPFEHYGESAGGMDRTSESYQLNLSHDMGNGMTFESYTYYSKLDKDYREDGDGLPVLIINFQTLAEQDQFTQEFRLLGETESMKWQVGAFYMDMEMDNAAVTQGAPVAGAADSLGYVPDNNQFVEQDYTLTSKNWSVFGESQIFVTEALSITAGIRWSQDDKKLRFNTTFNDPTGTGDSVELFDLAAAVDAISGDQDEIDYGDWAGRLGIDYRLSDDTLLFASWNRGIKGGNWTVSADVSLDKIRHDEEVLYSYEAGFKTQFAEGAVRLNGTVFYYDYQDYQAFSINGGTPQVLNSDAESMGGELELYWTPTDNWDFSFGAAVLDTSVDEVFGPEEQVPPAGLPAIDWPVNSLSGNELPNAPRFSFNYLARYNMDVMGGNLSFQVDGNYNDDQWLEVTNRGGSFQEAYNVTNVRATFAHQSGVEVTGYVRNVFDEEYKLYMLNLGLLGQTGLYAPPAIWGVSVNYDF